jgi:hypothetical protein
LSLDEEHRRFRINGSGFDFIELLQGRQRQITEKMFFADGANQAIVEDI